MIKNSAFFREFTTTMLEMKKCDVIEILDIKKGIWKLTDKFFRELTSRVRANRTVTNDDTDEDFEDRLWKESARTCLHNYIPKLDQKLFDMMLIVLEAKILSPLPSYDFNDEGGEKF